MPCSTDHMEPTVAERQRRDAAKLALYVYTHPKVNGTVPEGLEEDAKDAYGGTKDWVEHLCTLMHSLSPEVLPHVVYDPRNGMSRKLADWWEEHLVEDKKRLEYEEKSYKNSIVNMHSEVFKLFGDACQRAEKASNEYPQPNYVISKVAEEAGEVVKEAIHCAEGRGDMKALREEIVDCMAMLVRLYVEGDEVHGLAPVIHGSD